MEGHRIGVISDTHGLLRPEVEAVLKTCEAILHAGDVGRPEVLDRLRAIAATYAVRGNVDSVLSDPGAGDGTLPEELETELFGFSIYMVHNKKQIRKDLSGVDAVIYGHSHKYGAEHIGGITWLNPGSCGPRRFRLPVTMMVLTLYPAGHRMEIEKIDCLSMASKPEETLEIPERDLYALVREIMKEVDAGKRIAEIAARNQIEEAFAEQVCRMYLTHPGVDVDGILDRMERMHP